MPPIDPVTGALIGAGSNVVGGLLGQRANDDAANVLRGLTVDALGEIRRGRDRNIDALGQFGGQAQNTLLAGGLQGQSTLIDGINNARTDLLGGAQGALPFLNQNLNQFSGFTGLLNPAVTRILGNTNLANQAQGQISDILSGNFSGSPQLQFQINQATNAIQNAAGRGGSPTGSRALKAIGQQVGQLSQADISSALQNALGVLGGERQFGLQSGGQLGNLAQFGASGASNALNTLAGLGVDTSRLLASQGLQGNQALAGLQTGLAGQLGGLQDANLQRLLGINSDTATGSANVLLGLGPAQASAVADAGLSGANAFTDIGAGLFDILGRNNANS